MRLGKITGPLVCGVDEAGRGPLAGPVVAAAVILCPDFEIEGLDDSKRLSPAGREKQRARLLASSSRWGIGVAESNIIDSINILQATFLAMNRAIESLGIVPEIVLVDGHLKIPDLPFKQEAIISGDRLEPCIAAASILAKTYRDDIMRELARQYPEYGFEKHKGYATKKHLASLQSIGPCLIHRKSFHPVSTFYVDQAIDKNFKSLRDNY
jgi:ribonuclease HII